MAGERKFDVNPLPPFYIDGEPTELLSAQEEAELSVRIKKAQEAQTTSVQLDPDAVDELAKIIFEGENALNDLINSNKGLLLSIVYRTVNTELPWDDRFSLGAEGLGKAAEKFDGKKGRFTTYATPAIERKIISEARTPKRRKKNGVDIKHIYILDEPAHGDDGSDLIEFIEDPNSQDVEGLVDYCQLQKILRDELNRLPPKEAMVLKLRYGISDVPGEYLPDMTYEEIGKELKVNHQRANQLEKQALKRIRSSSSSSKLKPYS